MKKKQGGPKRLSAQETQLIEQLRQPPEIRARVQSILEMAGPAQGPLKTADEVEPLLMEEMRRLGGATLGHWATQAEERLSQELKTQDPSVRSRKKKTLKVVVCFRVGESARAHLEQSDQELSAPFAGTLGSYAARPVSPAGPCADGLWLRTFVCPGGGKCARTLRV